jgi:hypothetical protein
MLFDPRPYTRNFLMVRVTRCYLPFCCAISDRKKKEAPALSQGFVENGAVASILRQVRAGVSRNCAILCHQTSRLLSPHHNLACTHLCLMTARETVLWKTPWKLVWNLVGRRNCYFCHLNAIQSSSFHGVQTTPHFLKVPAPPDD